MSGKAHRGALTGHCAQALAAALAGVLCGLVAQPVGADGARAAGGYVGLRPLPRTAADHAHSHGGSWAGLPTFAQQAGNYPFVAAHLDVVMGWLGGDFQTRRMFFEYYLGLNAARDDPDPTRNQLVSTIRKWERDGGVIEHILVCREYRLAIRRGYPEAQPGPFPEDTRILSHGDVGRLRKLLRRAHARGLTRHPDYKLIQLVEAPAFFAENPAAREVVSQLDGVAYEVHQFNRHWPLESGWSNPDKVVRGARWTLAQGGEFILYFGPILWQSDRYREFIERDWLRAFWQAGLPRRHPRVHYYLNCFPHAAGRGRPVGPESNPHSVLGLTKWLIGQVKGVPAGGTEAATPGPR